MRSFIVDHVEPDYIGMWLTCIRNSACVEKGKKYQIVDSWYQGVGRLMVTVMVHVDGVDMKLSYPVSDYFVHPEQNSKF